MNKNVGQNPRLLLTRGLSRSNSIHSTFDAIIWWSTKVSLREDVTSNSAGTSTKINK